MTPLLQASNLNVVLSGTPILHDLQFTLEAGTCTGVVGPNGSGKTTLLRTISGTVAHDGRLMLHGKPIRQWTPRRLARHLAYVRQHLPLSFDFAVQELVLLGRAPHKGWLEPYDTRDRSQVRDVLDDVGLTGFADRSVLSLSGGERQRVLLAQALVQDAELLLLDEPTTHLDVRYQYAFLRRVRALADAGRTILIVFHDLQLAARFSDHLLVLDRGRLADAGPPEQVLTSALIADVFGMTAQVTCSGPGLRIDFAEPVQTAET